MTLRGIQCLWGEGGRDGGYYLLANYHLFKDKPRGQGQEGRKRFLGDSLYSSIWSCLSLFFVFVFQSNRDMIGQSLA